MHSRSQQELDGDDDDDDDDDTSTVTGETAPVVVSARVASSVATTGQDFYVAIILNGDAEISSAVISLNYDPNIFDVKGVRDGGLFRAGGNTEPRIIEQSGRLTVTLERQPEQGGVRARGQLLLIVFTPKGRGQSSLSLDSQTVLYSKDGRMILVKLENATVEAR